MFDQKILVDTIKHPHLFKANVNKMSKPEETIICVLSVSPAVTFLISLPSDHVMWLFYPEFSSAGWSLDGGVKPKHSRVVAVELFIIHVLQVQQTALQLKRNQLSYLCGGEASNPPHNTQLTTIKTSYIASCRCLLLFIHMHERTHTFRWWDPRSLFVRVRVWKINGNHSDCLCWWVTAV